MLLRRAPGFVAALILLPLSILAPALPGYSLMICRLTGTIVATECGGAVMQEAGDAPAPADNGWDAGSCCDTLRVTFTHAPAEVHAEALAITAFFLPVPWYAAPALDTARTNDAHAAAPPGLGPPRRLITQSFLI